MADVKATALPVTQAFDPNTDYLMALRGDVGGPRSGPYLVPGARVTVGSAITGGDGTGGGGTNPTGGITKVFGREGPEIAAQASDYDAAQIDYDPTTSGLAADNVQTAIDAVAALRETLPVPGSDGDLLTATGGEWSSQPPAVESVFGRSGAIDGAAGDYQADQIAVQKETAPGSGVFIDTTNRFVTAAQIAKLTALDTALQIPDPTAATLGHVLTVVDDGGTKAAAYAAPPEGNGGGGLSQIDLFPHLVPDASTPPSWVYANGVWAWHFANSGTQPLVAAIDYWPGGTATINLTWSCSVTAGNVQFFYTLTAITPDSGDLIDKAGSAWQATWASAAADNAKKSKRYTATISGLDSVAAGDFVLIKVWRNNGAAGNAAGTAVLRGCTLRFDFS